jgi:NADH:ubiquinone oxidoreductase subunit 6 (subunit J)
MLLVGYSVVVLVGLVSAVMIGFVLNPVHRIGLLVLLFLVGAFFYILLDWYFLGLTYIIVYCGAIAILFVFVMMVTASSGANTAPQYLFIGFVLAAVATMLLPECYGVVHFFTPNWAIEFISLTDIHTLATMLYVAYPVTLFIIALALWTVMIGIIKLLMSSY